MQVNSTLSVKTFDVGPMLNIIYLVWDKKTKEAALVDPAWNLNPVLDFIKENNLRLKKILLTSIAIEINLILQPIDFVHLKNQLLNLAYHHFVKI